MHLISLYVYKPPETTYYHELDRCVHTIKTIHLHIDTYKQMTVLYMSHNDYLVTLDKVKLNKLSTNKLLYSTFCLHTCYRCIIRLVQVDFHTFNNTLFDHPFVILIILVRLLKEH